MIEMLQAVILGAIEGVTEFLPVSSTAHLLLASRVLGFGEDDFSKTFAIVIQLGAIMAVVALYWRTLTRDLEAWKRIMTAFVPTAVIGLLAYTLVKRFLMESIPLILAALAVGGAVMIVFERRYARRPRATGQVHGINSLTLRQCFLIGLCQSLAIVPGVSRSAATVIGGLLLGIDRRTVVEFSFLLAVPTMLAASGLDLLRSAGGFSARQFFVLAVGAAVAAGTAVVAVRWLLGFIVRRDFRAFGWYRILLVAAILAAGLLSGSGLAA